MGYRYFRHVALIAYTDSLRGFCGRVRWQRIFQAFVFLDPLHSRYLATYTPSVMQAVTHFHKIRSCTLTAFPGSPQNKRACLGRNGRLAVGGAQPGAPLLGIPLPPLAKKIEEQHSLQGPEEVPMSRSRIPHSPVVSGIRCVEPVSRSYWYLFRPEQRLADKQRHQCPKQQACIFACSVHGDVCLCTHASLRLRRGLRDAGIYAHFCFFQISHICQPMVWFCEGSSLGVGLMLMVGGDIVVIAAQVSFRVLPASNQRHPYKAIGIGYMPVLMTTIDGPLCSKESRGAPFNLMPIRTVQVSMSTFPDSSPHATSERHCRTARQSVTNHFRESGSAVSNPQKCRFNFTAGEPAHISTG